MNAKKLTLYILLGMFLGLVLGVILNIINQGQLEAAKALAEAEGLEEVPATFIDTWLIGGFLHVGGKIFVAFLKLMVVPLVFVSLVCGTAALDDLRKLGKVGSKTLGLYLFTTAVAISLAVSGAMLLQPGVGFEVSQEVSYTAKEAPPLTDVFINIFPTNPISAMAQGKMLQIIVFSILFGIGLTLSGDAGKRVLAIFNDLNEVILKIVMLLMYLAPVGVFCLIAVAFGREGFAAFAPLLKYFFLVVGVLLLHGFGTYTLLLTVLARLNPFVFLKKVSRAQLFAFSTASSNATIPVTMSVAEKDLGVNKSIASFTVPLGATINMDGTAIMQGVATVFIAQVYGIDFGVSDFLTVILTATLASIGTAGVPGVGMIMLAMVLQQVGLPVEGIGLIIGVDRLLDMVRTAVNITGDSVVTCIVAKGEKQLDTEVFASTE